MAIADRHGLPVSATIASGERHEVRLVQQTLDARFTDEAPGRLVGDGAAPGAIVERGVLGDDLVVHATIILGQRGARALAIASLGSVHRDIDDERRPAERHERVPNDARRAARRIHQLRIQLGRWTLIVGRRVQLWHLAILRVTWTGTLARDLGPCRAGQVMTAHIAQFIRVRDGRVCAIETFDCYEPFN